MKTLRPSSSKQPLALCRSIHENLLCPVRTAYHRSGEDFEEAVFHAPVAELVEVGGGHVAVYRQVVLGRAQVLAKGEDIDFDCTQITHGLAEFFFSLSQAQHDGTLGQHLGAMLLGVFQHFQGLIVGGPVVPHCGGESSHGFDVMGEDIDAGSEDGFDSVQVALEVGGERFHLHPRVALLDLSDTLCEVGCAAIVQVVTIHRGHDDVIQAHLRDGHADVLGLVDIDPAFGVACIDCAELASPCTDAAQHHNRHGAMAPAFANVGAVGFLANRVKAQFLAHGPQPLVVRPGGQGGPQPNRFAPINRFGACGCHAVIDDLQRDRSAGTFIEQFDGLGGHVSIVWLGSGQAANSACRSRVRARVVQ